MYSLVYNILNYTGSMQGNTVDQYCIYCSLAIIMLLLAVFIDLLYRLLRSFIRK